ncbi:hypothetical protein UFOVP1290_499 [uncultured Caudovirales phage]|uniref:Uncharacterized protein n=1 Tax=uncultured Caudovirales phage TaxID=2100421 RepID=A0A6J5RIZ8_9CAUD|nr:hypothetical protein UFOVP1290_499 [uncultured Caudovirales phage]
MIYSDLQLKNLAHENPKELAKILTSANNDARMLTYGAEILGEEVTDENIVVPVLRQLLGHNHALVREGAMIGLSSFFYNKQIPKDILDKLKVMSTNDPQPNNRKFAKDLILSIKI